MKAQRRNRKAYEELTNFSNRIATNPQLRRVHEGSRHGEEQHRIEVTVSPRLAKARVCLQGRKSNDVDFSYYDAALDASLCVGRLNREKETSR